MNSLNIKKPAIKSKILFIIIMIQILMPLNGNNRTIDGLGEKIWEDSIALTSEGTSWNYPIDMGVGAVYIVTIRIDKIDQTYNITCSVRSPPDLTINGYSWSDRYYVGMQDGDSLNFNMSSNIHISDAKVSLSFNSRDSVKDFPKNGFTGKITVHEINSGIKDQSFYRSKILMNSNKTFVTIIYPPTDGALKTGFGTKAIIKMEVNLDQASTSDLRIESIQYFLDSRTNFSEMIITPGIVKEQIFELYDEMGDVASLYTFNITLESMSGHVEGELVMYLIQAGTYPLDPLISIFLTFIFSLSILILVVILGIAFVLKISK